MSQFSEGELRSSRNFSDFALKYVRRDISSIEPNWQKIETIGNSEIKLAVVKELFCLKLWGKSSASLHEETRNLINSKFLDYETGKPIDSINRKMEATKTEGKSVNSIKCLSG